MAALYSLSSVSLSLSPRITATHGTRFHCEVGALRSVGASDPTSSIRRVRKLLLGSSKDAVRRPRVEKPSSWPCGARRKSSSATETQVEVLDDEDLRAGLNETVTEALKVMLAEDDKMLEKFKEKVDYVGEFLVQDGQIEAARSMLILRGMLDHEIYPQNEELEGPYKKAFNTLWCLLEDSGWLLKQPGSETPEVDDESEEPMLEIRYSESS